MYIYDTRTKGNIDNLPLDGWFFPCTKCEDITGLFQKDSYYINCCFAVDVNIPMCYKCIKIFKMNIEELNKEKVKNQEI